MQDYLMANGYKWDGTTEENKIAKSMVTKTDWKISSGGVEGAVVNDLTKNNRSGFSALPGGARDFDNDFNGLMSNGFWWCSSNAVATCSGCRGLTFDWEDLTKPFSEKYTGYSVRLVRDPD